MQLKYFLACCITGATALQACNSPVSKREGPDSANIAVANDNPLGGDSVALGPPAGPGDATKGSYNKQLRYQHYKIAVHTEGDASLQNLVMAVTDLRSKDTTRADSIKEQDIKGNIQETTVADLDKDGKPELYCFTVSEGTERAGSLYGFVLDKGRATRIQLQDTLSSKEYGGHDTFYIKPPYLVRTFAAPEGKRSLQYRLKREQGGYVLKQ